VQTGLNRPAVEVYINVLAVTPPLPQAKRSAGDSKVDRATQFGRANPEKDSWNEGKQNRQRRLDKPTTA
jgi:hypothetical protein